MIDCRDFGFKKCDKVERGRGLAREDLPSFPLPLASVRLVYQNFNQSVEEIYFWLLTSLREDWQLPDVRKIKDVFTAAEQSAFWGQAQQRLQIQQGQVSNYLATIGKLIKELFQLVRELKILDERLELYDEAYKAIDAKGAVFDRRMSHAAEVTMRSYWIDLKDGGVKSPGSVYGLASTLGYTALPDIFFAAPPMKKEEVDSYVDKQKFNPKLLNVLRRKLKSYCLWRDHTYKELSNRRNFTIKFLRQHYNSIKMYMSWVKPYLRNVKRLQMNFERTLSEDIIGSFEGSVTEIEIICSRKINTYHAAVVVSLDYRTSPRMDFHQDGYQHKGPIHVGRTEFVMRGYVWSDKDFENYVAMRDAETFDMLGDIDSSLKEAIDALGDDLKEYLRSEGEKFPEDLKKEAEEEKKNSAALKNLKTTAEPFTAVFKGFADIFKSMNPITITKKEKGAKTDWELKGEKKKAGKPMTLALWNTYKNFKKANKMVTW